MVHVVYTDNGGKKGERLLDKIMLGEKTMIVRGAGGRKIPFDRVFAGNRLYFMEKGSLKISATAVVTAVKQYYKISEEEIARVFDDNAKALALSSKQRERWHKTCLCLVSFGSVTEISPQLEFEKQTNMDDWLMIEKVEDVCVGTSIAYNYEKSRLKGNEKKA